MKSTITGFHLSDLEVWLVKLQQAIYGWDKWHRNLWIHSQKKASVLKSVILNSQGERTYGELPIGVQKCCPAMSLLGKGTRFLISLFIPNDPSSQFYSFGFSF